MGKRKIEKYMDQFMVEISKLEVSEFMGILTLCGIKPYTKSKEAKEFDVLLEELYTKVSEYSKVKRRNLMRILRAANKGR